MAWKVTFLEAVDWTSRQGLGIWVGGRGRSRRFGRGLPRNPRVHIPSRPTGSRQRPCVIRPRRRISCPSGAVGRCVCCHSCGLHAARGSRGFGGCAGGLHGELGGGRIESAVDCCMDNGASGGARRVVVTASAFAAAVASRGGGGPGGGTLLGAHFQPMHPSSPPPMLPPPS